MNRKMFNGKAYPVIYYRVLPINRMVLECRTTTHSKCKEYGLPIEIQYWKSIDNNYETRGFIKLLIYNSFQSYKSWCKNEFNIEITLDDFKKMKKYCEDFRIVEIKNDKAFDKECMEICGKYYTPRS